VERGGLEKNEVVSVSFNLLRNEMSGLFSRSRTRSTMKCKPETCQVKLWILFLAHIIAPRGRFASDCVSRLEILTYVSNIGAFWSTVRSCLGAESCQLELTDGTRRNFTKFDRVSRSPGSPLRWLVLARIGPNGVLPSRNATKTGVFRRSD
jgi:hypothetical protein